MPTGVIFNPIHCSTFLLSRILLERSNIFFVVQHYCLIVVIAFRVKNVWTCKHLASRTGSKCHFKFGTFLSILQNLLWAVAAFSIQTLLRLLKTFFMEKFATCMVVVNNMIMIMCRNHFYQENSSKLLRLLMVLFVLFYFMTLISVLMIHCYIV